MTDAETIAEEEYVVNRSRLNALLDEIDYLDPELDPLRYERVTGEIKDLEAAIAAEEDASEKRAHARAAKSAERDFMDLAPV